MALIPTIMLAMTLAACDAGSQEGQEDRFANMFVPEVSDTFSPGLQIGDTFPAISARYEGDEVMSIDRFVRDKGAIFIATRSVDW